MLLACISGAQSETVKPVFALVIDVNFNRTRPGALQDDALLGPGLCAGRFGPQSNRPVLVAIGQQIAAGNR